MPTTELEVGTVGRDLGRARLFVVIVTVVALGVAGFVLVRLGAGPLPDPEGCKADVAGSHVELSTDQAENASAIAAVAVRRGLPARAVSIALAAAFQESKLHNLRYGDRDSVGLFQQRPSQGWGTRTLLLDPEYAAGAFYDQLVKIDGYQEMPITEAAQQVQRSGFPDAYAEHETGARALASALTGYSPARFSCVVHNPGVPTETAGSTGLTPRAEKVKTDLEHAFGGLPMGGFAPGGVSSGHMTGSAHYDGRAIDVLFRPVTAEGRRYGWAVAAYLVANANRLNLATVIYDGHIWSVGRSSESGWRAYDPPGDPATDPATEAVLEHRDHVHVDVVAGLTRTAGANFLILRDLVPESHNFTGFVPFAPVTIGGCRGSPGGMRDPMSSSMLYTMGMALDRAAENGFSVAVLIDGAWLEGLVAAHDGVGVVLESHDGGHAVVKTDRIAAVKVTAESPYRAPITDGHLHFEDHGAFPGRQRTTV